MSVPSNLIPTRITQLPVAPVADENSLMMIVYQGNNYQIRVGDLLSVAGVPITRQVIAGTGMTGGGQLSSNVTLSIAPGGVGTTQLANSGVTAGTYGTATDIPVFTVDATGRVMAATTVPATISGYVPDSRQVIAGSGLSGGGPLSSNVTLSANLASSTPLAGYQSGVVGTSTDMARADHRHPAVNLAVDDEVDGILGLNNGGTAKSLVPDEGAIIWCGADGLYVGPVGAAGQLLQSTGIGEYTWVDASTLVVARADDLSGGAANQIAYQTSPNNTSFIPAPTVAGYLLKWNGSSFEWGTIAGAGTVTSVDASGGTTGMTFTGGPITSGGTLTMSGTLVVANGGTGVTSLTGYVKGTGSSPLTASSTIPNTDITGLGTMSTQDASAVAITGGAINAATIGGTTPAAGTFTSVAMTSGTITSVPVSGNDIVNKTYADSISAGLNFHQSCRLATAAALPSCTYNNGTSGVGATLTATANGALSVDGTAVVATNRILVKNQVNQAQNGVYVVTQTGSAGAPFILTRATDYNTAGSGVNQIDAGDFFLITAGATLANTSWVQQTPLPITVGTTAIVFSQFAAPIVYTAGTGLSESPAYTFNIANTGVSSGSYGGAATAVTLSINAQGQITSATNVSISIAGSQITSGTVGSAYISGSYTGITGVGTLTAGTWNATAISPGYGGTGLTSYTVGDIIYASGATTLSKLAGVATGNVLLSGGVATAPSWGKVDLASAVSGTLPTSSGGTGLTSFTSGGAVYASSTSALTTGTLPIASGGTNASTTPTAGAVAYGTGTAYGFSLAGTANQVLLSGGSGAPTWSAQSSLAVGTATNLAGGAASQIPYQTGAGATSFIANGTAGQILTSAGSGVPTWSGINGGTF